MNDNVEIFEIDYDDLENFIHKNLTELGFVPESLEVEAIADIFLELLVHTGLFKEIE